jgi:hypothetical protein
MGNMGNMGIWIMHNGNLEHSFEGIFLFISFLL